jgi:hypothetical protein
MPTQLSRFEFVPLFRNSQEILRGATGRAATATKPPSRLFCAATPLSATLERTGRITERNAIARRSGVDSDNILAGLKNPCYLSFATSRK